MLVDALYLMRSVLKVRLYINNVLIYWVLCWSVAKWILCFADCDQVYNVKSTLWDICIFVILVLSFECKIDPQQYLNSWITRAFIPDDPTQVINGFDFTLNFPSFIPYDKISGIKSNFNKFNFSQSTPILESNNVHSDSTLQNLKSYLLTTFLIVILALWIFWFSKKCRGRVVNGRWTFVKKLLSKLVIKMNETLLFGYFIRSFLEMIQFSAISSIHEVLKFDASEVFSLISLIVALCYITTLIIIFGIMIYLALSSYIVEENEPNKLGDFFEGMKMKRSFKFYAPMMIARRVIFVLLLVSLNSISSKTLIGILSFLQLLYMIYVAYLRPYSEIKWNIIDIMNEVYFLLLLFTLIFLNEERDWNNVKSSTYMWTIASSSMVTFCIVLGKYSYYIFSRFDHPLNFQKEKEAKIKSSNFKNNEYVGSSSKYVSSK